MDPRRAAALESGSCHWETAWAIPEPPPPPVRMAANANPAFEVATIKPSDPAKPQQIITLRGAEVITTNVTVHDLINLAYWLHPKQLAGGPAWTESDKCGKARRAGPAKRRPDEDDDSEAAGRTLPAQIPLREERSLGIRGQDRKNGSENYQEPGRSERPSRSWTSRAFPRSAISR